MAKYFRKFAVFAGIGALLLVANPGNLNAQQTISGMKVGIVEAGSGGKVETTFRQIKRKGWGEYGADGKLLFQFEEAARDEDVVVLYDKKRDLTIVLDLAAGIVTFGQPEDQQPLYEIVRAKPVPNSIALASSKAGTEIDQFIRTLEYDPNKVVARSAPGSSINKDAGRPVREDVGGRVTVTTQTPKTAGGPIDQFTLVNPAPDAIYPGSVVLADTNLADGKPTPVAGKKAAITISVDLGGAAPVERTIEEPRRSKVETAVKELLTEYFLQRGESTQAANSVATHTRVYSKEQAAASLDIAAEWASGSASAKLEGSGSSETEVVVAFFKQKYYTISVDTPESPSALFDKDLPVDALQVAIDNTKPPGYISSVDYGRIVLVRMETKKSDLNIKAEAAFSQEFGSKDEDGKSTGKAEGNANAEYKKLVENASFSAVVLGGNPVGAPTFSGNIDQLQAYIDSGAVFDQKNPGVPISYTVRFLKDNSVASVNLTTDYMQTETTYAKNGFLDFYNGCACTIGAVVSYGVTGEPNIIRWADDNIKVAGNRYWPLPGDAQGINVTLYRYETFGSVQTTYVVPGLETTPTGAPAKCIATSGTFFSASADVKDGRC